MHKLTGVAFAELNAEMSVRGASHAEIVSAAGYFTESGRLNFTSHHDELLAAGHRKAAPKVLNHRYRIIVSVMTQGVIEVSSADELSPEQVLSAAQAGNYELVELNGDDCVMDLDGIEEISEISEGVYSSW
jgi:hypothetical protein